MAAVEDLRDAALDRIDLIGTFGLRVEDAKNLDAGVVLHERQRNDDGFVFDFGEAEGRDALAENAYNREAELTHANRATDGIVEAKNAVGNFLGDETDFATLLHVGRIEVAAAHDDEAANRLIAESDADEIDGTLFAGDDDGHRELARAGNLGDAGNVGFDGVHVVERDFVAERRAFAAGIDEFDVNHVRADRFDLPDHVFLASERDGDDQDNRGATDDDAERCEDGTEFIGSKGVDCNGKRFAQVHHGYDFFRRLRASEAVRLLGSSFSAA